MKPDDYPAQEPLSEFARGYHNSLIEKAAQLQGAEITLGDNAYQSLVYYPAAAPNGTVLIMIHGGGWTSGYKEWMAFMAPELNRRGISFVSLGYRLAPDYIFPTGLEDCMAGIAWVYDNIDKVKGERDRIFVSGHSAGGHYASLMAVRRDWQQGFNLPLNVIRACLPVSGVYDFGENSGLTMRPRFLGEEGNEEEASPIANISDTPPPFFIAYGSNDFPHLRQQALDMAKALEDAGAEATRIELPGRDHLGASLATGEADGPWLSPAVEWMLAH